MEEEKQEIVEEITPQQEEVKAEEPKEEGPKWMSEGDDSVIKVDLSKPPPVKEDKKEEDAVREQSTDEVPVRDEPEASEEVQQENVETAVEEVAGEEESEPVQTEEPVDEVQQPVEAEKEVLPENIQKLVNFMDETGGSVEDYVRLNKDYSDMDNLDALREYYKTKKPHLSNDEVEFLIEEEFKYEEDVDDEKDIRKKKIALKEQVAEAKAYLDGQKSKYYDEIKAGSKLTKEQQKAVDFFNRYNKESEQNEKQQKTLKDTFLKKTDQVFNNSFKGFEYNVGDKNFRFNVKNANEVKSNQSDINNFVKRFLNEDGTMSDAKGYHKSLYTAMNADAVAKHFYEQGRADALKESVAKAKNVDMSPRQEHKTIEAGGLKFKILGDDAATLRFKGKRRK